MKKQHAIIIMITIAVLVLGVVLLKQTNDNSGTKITYVPPAQINIPPEKSITFSGEGKIEIPQTISITNPIIFNKVTVPGNSFVVIKDTSGKVIGSSNLIIFPQTTNLQIAIDLLKNKTYTAQLHGDNGDGIFNTTNDPPIILNGKTVTTTFKTN